MKAAQIFSIIFLLSYSAFGQNSGSIEKRLDVVYTERSGWQGKLDLYLQEGKKKNPLVIYIHGGGWTHGKKEAEYQHIKVFIENGFSVANVEYRLASQAPAPAAIEDVHCAVAYLWQKASELRIDKEKIVIMGGSAGAHLALLEGLQSVKPVYTGGCEAKSLKIAAIISKYGPTDLLSWKQATDSGSASSSWIGERKTDTAFIKSLSPIY